MSDDKPAPKKELTFTWAELGIEPLSPAEFKRQVQAAERQERERYRLSLN